MPRAVNSFLLLLTMFAATAAAAPASAPATQPKVDLSDSAFAHGNGDNYWMTFPVPDERPPKTIALQRYPDGKWVVLERFYGQVKSLADYQGDLVVVLTDGSWRTIYDGGSTAGVEPPDDAKVIALAGDGDTLYAVVRNKAGYQLAQLVGRKWSIVSALPDVAQQGDKALIAMGVVDHELVVAVRTVDEHVAVFSSRQQSWDTMGIIFPKETVEELIVLAMGRQVGIWVSPGTTNGGAVYMDPPTWQKRIDMGPDPGEAAVASERLRLIYKGNEKGKDIPMEKQWDFNGKPLPAQKLSLPTPDFFTPYISWGMWAAFGLIVLLFLARRPKDEVPPEQRS